MKKIRQEKKYISKMVSLYCNWGTGQKKVCSACEELVEYVHDQIDHCPYGSTKVLCRSCKNSCFSDDMKAKFTEAVNGSNIRMMLFNPYLMLQLSWIDIQDAKQMRG